MSHRDPQFKRRATSSDPFEPLESRLLLAFSANINFQPAGEEIPRGYRADTGAVFASRGKGQTFGWNSNNAKTTFDRDSARSRDQRYDTGASLQGRTWEIAAPNGSYSVHIVAGDANLTSASYRINAESTRVVDGSPSRRHRWVEGTKNVAVRDGKLTLTSASGARNNRINFIQIKLIDPQVRVRASDAAASEPGSDRGAFTISRTGKTAKSLRVRYTLSGSATNGSDYQSLGGSVVIPKGSSSVVVRVAPRDDSAIEGTESVTLTLRGDKLYALRKGKQATVNIADNDSKAAPSVTISASDSKASEAGKDTGRFVVSRTGGTKNPLTVNLSITGSAKNGNDYNTLSNKITIPAGQSSATITVTPKDDSADENNESVTLAIAAGTGYKSGSPSSASVTISDNDTSPSQPAAPTILEPTQDNQLVNGADVHMEIDPATDGDSTDWEIWTTGSSPVRVWRALNVSDEELDNHTHFGDGTFEGPQSGKDKLEPSRTYEIRVRIHVGNQTSPYSRRTFRTRAEEIPTAEGWVSRQAGYEVQEIPFIFPTGEQDWRLPTNIAFVPDSVRGNDPNDPLFYVTELYGSIRVVTNNFTVRTYATGLLNYNPNGPFGGAGENGLTGLVVDPANGDVYATMLYDLNGDGTNDTFPKVTRFRSTNGGLTATDTNPSASGTQGTDILLIQNTADSAESMRASHIISNITFGPDNKLYVHVGEGFQPARARNINSFGGKILRLNKDGSAPTDNPFYEAGDRHSDGKPDAADYVYALGLRNPFGGAWREPSGSRPAQHFTVENGPTLDRLSMLVEGRDYLWTGSDASMRNFNIAYSPSGSNFPDGAPDWSPPPAPVNIAFIQNSTFGGSNFPSSKFGHAFVTQSGPTYAAGPNYAKSIEEWIIDNDGNRIDNFELISYEGAGRASAAAIAAGPDGLYFSTLYPDDSAAGPTGLGAKILRVVFTGAAAASAQRAPATQQQPTPTQPSPTTTSTFSTITISPPPTVLSTPTSLLDDDAPPLI